MKQCLTVTHRMEYAPFKEIHLKPMKKALLTKLISASIFLLSAKSFAGTAYYYPTSSPFPNPERGFCDQISNSESFNQLVSAYPVARVDIRLDRFKNGANLQQDPCFLSGLADSFAWARAQGFKVRITFLYNYGTQSDIYQACNGQWIVNDGRDASLSTILNHISQLGQTLRDNSDVIYEIDAGFIGQFGEWHDSTYPGNDTISAHNQVITRERNNFPTNRHITVRRPAYKLNYLGCNCPGSYTWLGHHNQRFVDDSDSLLFNDPQGVWNSSICRTFYSNDVSFTANGADATQSAGRIAGDIALSRMQNYHYTIFTGNPDLFSYWQTSYPNQYAAIQLGLGYRFQVTQATTPDNVSPGGTAMISVKLINNGFSKLMNQRTMVAALNIGSSWASSSTFRDSNGSDDLRDLTLAAGEKTYTANFTLPATFPTGTAVVYLWLPDYAPSLQSTPQFSVQLDGVTWNPSLGANLLGSSLNQIQVLWSSTQLQVK